jgi:hypothetical protein
MIHLLRHVSQRYKGKTVGKAPDPTWETPERFAEEVILEEGARFARETK